MTFDRHYFCCIFGQVHNQKLSPRPEYVLGCKPLQLNFGHWWQAVQDLLRVLARTLHNRDERLKRRVRRVAQALVHPALARRDVDALLGAQPVERHDDLLPVAAADAVGDDVHRVARVAQVQRRLRDANVRLDADERHLRTGRQVGRQLGHHHRELGLVDGRRAGQVRGDAGHRRAELGGGLRRDVDGHGGGLGKGEQLLGGGDAIDGTANVRCWRREDLPKKSTYTLSNSCMALRNFSCKSQTLYAFY